MPLSTFALVSVDEFKEHVPIDGTKQDTFIERVINRASEMIERHLDRRIVSRGSITEFHTMRTDGQPFRTEKLRTLQWPILSVTSVHEDANWPRTYGAPSALVADEGYQLVADRGLIRRLSSGGPGEWATGLRSIRVVYTAGYAGTVAVPEHIKAVALRLGAVMYLEPSRRLHGIQSQTDSTGNFTRFGPATITQEMAADLYSERRHELFVTGEAAA